MVNNKEQFEHVHINTGGKNLSEEEMQEVKEFFNSEQFEEIIKKADEQHSKVMESKITHRTKM